MKMKKVLALGLATVMACSAFVGCGDSSANQEAAPSTEAGAESAEAAEATGAGSVYWLNFKPEADEALQGIAATYTEQTGVPVTVVTAASGEYNSTLTAEMEKAAAPTLFVVGNQAAVTTWKDYCYDLEGTSIYNELNTDSFTLRNDEGKVASIGYCYESFGIIVNKALLEKAGHSLDEINNFDSLKAVAEDIHANASTLGFDAFTSSGMAPNSSWRFSGHLANMPLYYEEQEDGWTECPAEIKGTHLDYFKNVWDLYTANSATDKAQLVNDGLDAEAEFLAEQAVFFQNGTWEYNALSALGDENLAMIPIYCGAPGEEKAGLCSGTENCWAVNAKASQEDIDATIAFMTWMVTSAEGTQCMMEQFGAIPYKNAAENTNVFFKCADEYMNAGNYVVDWAFNYTPNVDTWREGVVAAMNQYDAGGSWDDVETAFVAGWAAQYKAANE